MKPLHLLLTCGALVFLAGGADAQATSVAALAPAADPSRLPGDQPTPTLERMLRLPSGRPTGAAGPPPDAAPAAPQEVALAGAQAALSACNAENLLVNVVVVDSLGRLRLVLSADGADPAGVFVAAKKAVAATAFKSRTSDVQKRLRAGDTAALAVLKPNMIVLPGGVPLVSAGAVIGAIAASGATAEQDEACAALGAAKIQSNLK